MRQGLKFLFVLFFLIVKLYTIALSANSTAKHILTPKLIQSDYDYTLSLNYRISNDSSFIQYRVIGTKVPFSFGNSKFDININTDVYDIANAKITKVGLWDASNDINYNPITLSSNQTLQNIGIRISRKSIGGLNSSIISSTEKVLIAEVYLPVIKCRGVTQFAYDKNNTNVSNWLGEDITDDKTLMSTISYNTSCPCNAFFKGLDSVYCTASLLSRLTPAIPGGRFSGPGINFAAGICPKTPKPLIVNSTFILIM